MAEEPSVLDYVKSKLMPWKYRMPEDFCYDNPTDETGTDLKESSEVMFEKKDFRWPFVIPWKFIIALGMALIAQSFLEPPIRKIELAIGFYSASFLFIFWSFLSKEKIFDQIMPTSFKNFKFDFDNVNQIALGTSVILFLITLFAFKPVARGVNDIRFTDLNLFLWFATLITFVYAVIDQEPVKRSLHNLKKTFQNKEIHLKITPWVLLLGVTTIVVIFFRFYRLNEVLGEMFSDHAEKLLDVNDVLKGDYHVFFVRNTGREFLQFYLTAFVAIVFRTGVSFLSLKLGTALAGFFALPFIYKLGKELGNKWVGLFAFLLAGVSYWHNVISRVGLRFPLYPLFVAPTLFYLIRGIRQKRRNDFIYSGIALGLGLHGYSSTRFLPFVVLFAIFLFLIHASSRGSRKSTINALVILIITSVIVFLPLLKFSLISPEDVSYRALTRLAPTEQAYESSPFLIFLDNLWNAEAMFFYSNGNTWVHSIPGRPALDVITAALYFIGTMIVLLRYIRHRNWEDLFLILSVPLLMMPSILSLAFPGENPSLNRTGGAIIPVFILAAIAFEGVIRSLWKNSKTWIGKIGTVSIALSLLAGTAYLNYDLVFRQFDQRFLQGAWNTSQIGAVIRGFADSVGSTDNAYVVPYPHWVDTRVVGINVGDPTRDFALWPDQFATTLDTEGEKLFIIKPDNQEALELLQVMYPNGILFLYDSGREGKDFYIFHVPVQVIDEENNLLLIEENNS
jgi:hypothetical protein